jgi:hypothetical protein
LVSASTISGFTTNIADRRATILIAPINPFSFVENGGIIDILYAVCAEVSIGGSV